MLTAHVTKKNLSQQGFTLIELLVVIGILAILMGIVLIAINPARQFAQANNTTRANSVTQILNAIGQYEADNHGQLPAGITTGVAKIGAGALCTGTCVDLCTSLTQTVQYIPSFPEDPQKNNGAQITSCANYDSGFTVQADVNNRITVAAPLAELSASISATR